MSAAATSGAASPHGGARVIAHRGASALAPEHTLASFTTAMELSVDYVELDVHLTRDGEVVCIHDDDLDRTTDGSGPVRGLDLAAIQRLDAGSWYYPSTARPAWELGQLRVPTLAEVIELVRGRCGLCIEIKDPRLYPGIEARVLQTLRASGALDSAFAPAATIIQSFDARSLKRTAKLAPQVTRCRLTGRGSRFPRVRLQRISAYAHGIGPHGRTVTPALVRAAHGLGLFVHPYTINLPEDMRALLRMGVDGIISDNPVVLKRIVREYDGADTPSAVHPDPA